jgi:predicted PilT family ATPase
MISSIGGGQRLIPDGPAIVEGMRHGRLVHIETIGGHSLTVVQAKLPEFKAQSDDGKLIPDEGAPETLVRTLKSLRKAKRWRGIEVNAGSEGIGIQRESKGTNMWLYDLWLAEYLLGKVSAG